MENLIYLDYCATTPVHADVRACMLAALDADFGNPSSMHWAGKKAAELVSAARGDVAAAIGCQPAEIYFTGGATEADNLALLGVMRGHNAGQAHLITTSIEHHAVLHSAERLEKEGYAVTYLPVNGQGLVNPQDIISAIRPETVLISVMMVNNETGAIQPLQEIGAAARQRGILFHSDAVQGLGLLRVNVDELNLDLLSLSAHKIYGPKGIGALYVRDGLKLEALMYGGTQEKALRPGTENLPGIVGLGAAVRHVETAKQAESERLSQLRNYCITSLQNIIPGLLVNGPREAVSPHVLSVSFPGADGEMMLLRLGNAGFAVSMGSACTSHSIEPSHVLTAMGLPREQIEGTLRISFGFPSSREEVDQFLQIMPDIFQRALL